ncbi:hypothetical protein PIB30_106407, partial [Stylosanthes scabra]|nr:hypothetical protein [Stylosanthes scabra]
DLQAGPEVEAQAESEAQAEVGIVIGNEQQHDPVTVEADLQAGPEAEAQSEIQTEVQLEVQPEAEAHQEEVDDPVPINMEIPLDTQEQCSLTLRPWLQPEAGTSTPVQSPETMVTDVLLSMNRAESDNLLGDQCKTPDIPLEQQDLEE